MLPSRADVEAAYSLFGVGEKHPVEFTDGTPCCRCDRCEAWQHYIRGGCKAGALSASPVYEVITAELVDGLASWLQRARHEHGISGRMLRVVEVGAGDGRLTCHLRQHLAKAGSIELTATDSFARGITPANGAVVRSLDYQQALDELAPDIVLCCWLPLGSDWTSAFRACTSVCAYVLVGEVDDGCCGRPWATWGYLAGVRFVGDALVRPQFTSMRALACVLQCVVLRSVSALAYMF